MPVLNNKTVSENNESVLFVILFIVLSIWTYLLLHMTLSGLEASTNVILWDRFKYMRVGILILATLR